MTDRCVWGDFLRGYRWSAVQETHAQDDRRLSLRAIKIGRIFRDMDLPMPKALFIDGDGVMCARLEDGAEFAVFVTAREVSFIDASGVCLDPQGYRDRLSGHPRPESRPAQHTRPADAVESAAA